MLVVQIMLQMSKIYIGIFTSVIIHSILLVVYAEHAANELGAQMFAVIR